MRIIFKVFAIPFMIALTILVPVLTFLFCISQQILNFISGLFILAGIALAIFARDWLGGGISLGIAFLVSPVGLPAIADWLIEKLASANYALRDFITG